MGRGIFHENRGAHEVSEGDGYLLELTDVYLLETSLIYELHFDKRTDCSNTNRRPIYIRN